MPGWRRQRRSAKKYLLSAAKASQRLTPCMNEVCRAQPTEGGLWQEGGDASDSAALADASGASLKICAVVCESAQPDSKT